jgi:hypothetical protein
MACRSCRSENQTELDAEVNIHFAGQTGLDQPHVLACPRLTICLSCGFTQCTLTKDELGTLREGVTVY